MIKITAKPMGNGLHTVVVSDNRKIIKEIDSLGYQDILSYIRHYQSVYPEAQVFNESQKQRKIDAEKYVGPGLKEALDESFSKLLRLKIAAKAHPQNTKTKKLLSAVEELLKIVQEF